MPEPAQFPMLPAFGVANYRSFGPEGFALDSPNRVNVLIGKNNTGKSNVLRAIQLLGRFENFQLNNKHLSPLTDNHRRSGQGPLVMVRVPFRQAFPPNDHWHEALLQDFERKSGKSIDVQWEATTGRLVRATPLESLGVPNLKVLVERTLRMQFGNPPSDTQPYLDRLSGTLMAAAVGLVREPLQGLLVVPVFREVRAESGGQQTGGAFDGRNIIEMLRDMQHPTIGEEEKRDVFDKLSRFTRDLIGVKDLALEVPPKDNRLYVNMHGNRLPLENYGTGIHHLVILCAALAGHSRKVVTVEEPEVHLHPELQRRFLRFIAQETDNTYFLTTHSNAFLDTLPDVNVYHVGYDGCSSTVRRVQTPAAARDILTDMGYKASDLLQANGVIWVEGPSDRIYLNRWLGLANPELVEGIHYAVAFYGGKVLAHFSAADDPVDDLVQVLRINRHAVVVMDRDGDDEAVQLNRSKDRIQAELHPDACWVTQGREIENYVPLGLIRRSLAKGHPAVEQIEFGVNDSLDEVLTGMSNGPGRYDKVVFARRFCEAMTEDDLNVLDLRARLATLVDLIRRWNHADAPTTAGR